MDFLHCPDSECQVSVDTLRVGREALWVDLLDSGCWDQALECFRLEALLVSAQEVASLRSRRGQKRALDRCLCLSRRWEADRYLEAAFLDSVA